MMNENELNIDVGGLDDHSALFVSSAASTQPRYNPVGMAVGFIIIFLAFSVFFFWAYSYANNWWLALSVLTALALMSLLGGRVK